MLHFPCSTSQCSLAGELSQTSVLFFPHHRPLHLFLSLAISSLSAISLSLSVCLCLAPSLSLSLADRPYSQSLQFCGDKTSEGNILFVWLPMLSNWRGKAPITPRDLTPGQLQAFNAESCSLRSKCLALCPPWARGRLGAFQTAFLLFRFTIILGFCARVGVNIHDMHCRCLSFGRKKRHQTSSNFRVMFFLQCSY